jgi:hypothetical protein
LLRIQLILPACSELRKSSRAGQGSLKLIHIYLSRTVEGGKKKYLNKRAGRK